MCASFPTPELLTISLGLKHGLGATMAAECIMKCKGDTCGKVATLDFEASHSNDFSCHSGSNNS